MEVISKVQLDKLNKTTLVEEFLNLQERLVELSAQPLTSSEVERANLRLQLATAAAGVKSAEARASVEIEIEKLTQETELKIKELKLKYNSEKLNDIESIDSEFEALKAKVMAAKADLSHGLKEAEIANGEKIAAFEAKAKEAEVKCDEVIASCEEITNAALEEKKAAVKKAKDDKDTEISVIKEALANTKADLQLANTREVEQLAYDHKIALRDKNIALITGYANSVDKVIVEKDTVETLEAKVKALENNTAEEVKRMVGKAEGILKASLTREHEKEVMALENRITILENDKSHLTAQLSTAKETITKLEAQLAKVPGQIKDAVEAAKVALNVNQDAGKK